MDRFQALLASKTETGPSFAWTELGLGDLSEGDVVVRITHSTINYKDGLALANKAPIIRKWPLIPGIDFAGRVISSTSPDFAEGDLVTCNGWGMGETSNGGYAQLARVKADWLVKLPAVFDAAHAAAIGTAGYTSMLAVMALEEHGVVPARGAVLVTGAAGGVGSVAVAVLAKRGYRVVASTGRPEEEGFLKGLGASEIISRSELSSPAKPLGKERWAGAIDVAGSHTLANAISMTSYGGCVAACGLAQGMDLANSVAPFILRGVTLTGIDSVMAPPARRRLAWERLARDLDIAKLDAMSSTRPIADAQALAPEILAGKVRGRVVLEVA